MGFSISIKNTNFVILVVSGSMFELRLSIIVVASSCRFGIWWQWIGQGRQHQCHQNEGQQLQKNFVQINAGTLWFLKTPYILKKWNFTIFGVIGQCFTNDQVSYLIVSSCSFGIWWWGIVDIIRNINWSQIVKHLLLLPVTINTFLTVVNNNLLLTIIDLLYALTMHTLFSSERHDHILPYTTIYIYAVSCC